LLIIDGFGILCFVPANTPTQATLTPVTGRLEVVDSQDQRSIFLNGHLTARYSCSDKGTERVLATQLAAVLPLPDNRIASAFGMHPVTLSRFCGQVRSGGAAALMPRKTGPKGPSKMTLKVQARCRELRKQELSFRDIARHVSRGGRRISYVTVATLFKADEAKPKQQPLPIEVEATPQPEQPVTMEPEQARAEPEQPVSTEPEQPAPTAPPEEPVTLDAASFAEPRPTRYAGALMLYAALARLDLWSVFRQLGAEAGPSRRYGWAQTLATIVFCFALRFRSI